MVKYQKQIYFTVLKILAGDKQEAEDLTQEVFLTVYRKLHLFRFDSSFSSWVTRIAIHRAIDYKRKKRPEIIEEKHLELLSSQERDPQVSLLQNESCLHIKNEIKKLPEIYRQVIYHYYYEHLSYQEIAIKQGVEITTIQSRLYRAKKMLREVWKEEEE